MNLTDADKQSILQGFPLHITELSYDIITHKKVHNADIMLAIPEGIPAIAWFTSYKQFDVCFLLELNNSMNTITNVSILQTGFQFKLALGTIVQGVFFKWKNTNCFTIYDIYLYKGKLVTNDMYNCKLLLIDTMLTNDISQVAVHNNYTLFGLPLVSNNFQTMLSDIEQLPYKISKIKFNYFTSKKSLCMPYYKPGTNNHNNNNFLINTTLIFKVTPDIQNDIYNLLVYNNGKEEFYETAYIPDYKTSVFMNKLFRNIKENNNLDALEESDDEDEFENDKFDKYVYLDKSYKMVCEYNSKFNKWVPIKVVDNKQEKIVTLHTLRNNKQNVTHRFTNNNNNNNNKYNNKNYTAYNTNYHKYNKNINSIYNVSNKSR